MVGMVKWGLGVGLLTLAGVLSQNGPAQSEEASLAVAANFTEVIEVLVADFEGSSDHELTIVTGSTGQLYSQIANGAPFDIFLAADQERPERLEAEGGAVEGTRFTYAIGRITLWSPDPAAIGDDGGDYLANGSFRALAMANPDLAPYGVAARETLQALDLWDAMKGRIVLGENIGQTHAMVATGNAEAGFVALSYVLSPENDQPGSRWDVPGDLYSPIRQDAVLVARGRDNTAARAFLDYMRSDAAHETIRAYGYDVD
ncbi:molybdate ABC transporter substrate-binding protein [Pararhizobium haloflavum]|uniref:molybdate ABC transporter substrate-binding protein n=1 Tax=Pararhizobium haloflavum TaxID=2037914 RepID=UPI0018E49C82|nr:molybdate ABC transporter substrate-binding protein [Pararhizobium haloflavum]